MEAMELWLFLAALGIPLVAVLLVFSFSTVKHGKPTGLFWVGFAVFLIGSRIDSICLVPALICLLFGVFFALKPKAKG